MASHAVVVVFDPPEPVDLPPNTGMPVEFDIDGDGSIDFVFSSTTREKNIAPADTNRALADDVFGDEITTVLPDGTFIGAEAPVGSVWTGETGFLGGCASVGGSIAPGISISTASGLLAGRIPEPGVPLLLFASAAAYLARRQR